MLFVNQVHKSYGDDAILEGVTFVVNHGERIGLVGPNGCGKTTLLRIIVGQEEPDRGGVSFSPANLRIGYLEQALSYPDGATIGDVMQSGQEEAEREIEALSAGISRASGEALDCLMEAYAEALERFEAAEGYGSGARVAKVLAGLGLETLDQRTPIDILSGGQKTRLSLARLLLATPQLLLLDEPTNHLDIEALEWLEGFLSEYNGAMLIVSHDRTFLDQTVSAMLELDPMDDTELRSFLHRFLFTGDDVFVPIGSLSFGERARLALAKLVAVGCNLLILDEPINHLDIPSRERFEQGLSRFDGTVLAVVHDRYFIERFATRLWVIHDGTVHPYVDLEDMRRGMRVRDA